MLNVSAHVAIIYRMLRGVTFRLVRVSGTVRPMTDVLSMTTSRVTVTMNSVSKWPGLEIDMVGLGMLVPMDILLDIGDLRIS